MNIALLITTFNRPDTLDLVLQTVATQSRIPDEVVVCDDGSSIETSMVVSRWNQFLPIRHAWQPDRDFRAARSRNLGVSKSVSEYVVLVDGDCLLPANFVTNHIKLARAGYIVAGGRRLLADSETHALLSRAIPLESAFTHWKFRSIPLGTIRYSNPSGWKIVRTCNLGLYRDEFQNVGGFDEAYVGWGREDSDFVVRLLHLGLRIKSGRFAACVAHLHHTDYARDHLSINDSSFRSCLNDSTQVYSKSSILAES
ncbi:glycosyltransferase [Litorivicinus sp.]|nr:glycosyltransferase [Litorivicinus sp.]